MADTIPDASTSNPTNQPPGDAESPQDATSATGKASGAYTGWGALRVAVNVTLPAQLAAAERARLAALRVLGG